VKHNHIYKTGGQDAPSKKIENPRAPDETDQVPKPLLEMYKDAIIAALDIMRKSTIAEKQPFKARAYAKVIAQLKELPSVSTYADVEHLEGVGEKIREKIIEILATGSLQSAERALLRNHLDAHEAFLNVYGVGPAKAQEIVAAGIYTIDALRAEFKRIEAIIVENTTKKKKKSEHTKIPKYYNENTAIGLKYYESLLERIPRQEMLLHNSKLTSMLSPEFPFQMEVVGSFRRQAETSGDIDALIRIPREMNVGLANCVFKAYIEKLQIVGYINEILAIGDHKCMAICSIAPGKYRRLDLLLTPYDEYPYAILYFTGSDKFNVAYRAYCLTKGYTLNEHTMTPTNPTTPQPPLMNSEADIFRFLNLQYIEPQNRVNSNQIIPMATGGILSHLHNILKSHS
jgi:DNA polymerase lambda